MERFAIVGTAPSWTLTPWADTSLVIAGLNDMYQIPGIQRVDEWYDLHPLDHFYFVEKPPKGQKSAIYAHQVPFGYYVRPAKHLDWLATQTMPVWLSPDYATQLPTAATWPHAQPFPRAEIEAAFGTYFGSTPAWMLAHGILRGAKEIHIYGIHLATEQEYVEQRPNFEFLIGCVLGPGQRTLRRLDGKRYYETAHGLVVLPEASPLLSAKFQYAFEPSPRRKLDPIQWELHKAQVKQQRRMQALLSARWPVTRLDEPDDAGTIQRRWVTTSTLQQEVRYYAALAADYQDQAQRVMQGG